MWARLGQRVPILTTLVTTEQSILARNQGQTFPGICRNSYRQINQERLGCKAKHTRHFATYLGFAWQEFTQGG